MFYTLSMRTYTKYTKEMLGPLVRDSISVAEVLRKLDKKQTGSIATNLSKVIKKFEIDTSHFLGQRANSGGNHKGGPDKTPWQKVLVVRKNDFRESAFRLRRALIESGRTYECHECGISEWLGRELRLQVDHRNGDWSDNRPENLRFLCPNCHTQTENHSGSQGLTDLCSNYRQAKAYRMRKASPVSATFRGGLYGWLEPRYLLAEQHQVQQEAEEQGSQGLVQDSDQERQMGHDPEKTTHCPRRRELTKPSYVAWHSCCLPIGPV